MVNFGLVTSSILAAGDAHRANIVRAVIVQYAPLYQRFCEENMAISDGQTNFHRKLSLYNNLKKEIVESIELTSKRNPKTLDRELLWDIDENPEIRETFCSFEAGLVLIWASQQNKESHLKVIESALNLGANLNFEKLFPTQQSSMERDIFAMEIHPKIYSYFDQYVNYLNGEITANQMLEIAAIKDFVKLSSLTI